MHKQRLETGEITETQFRDIIAERFVDFLDHAHIYEKFQELLKSKNIKEVVSFEEFKDFLIRINGIIREIPIKDRKTDGENVLLEGFIDIQRLPRQTDKESLLLKTYEALNKVDKEDLQYFIPLMINAIHLFKDGNGRTSRIFNVLLNNFVNKDDLYFETTKALGIDGRYDYKDINPKSVNFDINLLLMNNEGISFENNTWPPILPKEFFGDKSKFMFDNQDFETNIGKKFIELYKHDQELFFLAIFKYLKSKNLLSKCIETNNELGGMKALSPALMEYFLTEEDFQNIIDGYFDLLKERTEMIIDSFVNPEGYRLIDDSMTVRDKILQSVNEPVMV